MKLAALVLLLALAPAPAADVKGKWQGKLTAERDDGSTHEDTALLILDQEGATVTGTFGGSERDQYPIASGTVDGNKVSIVARTANGHEFHLELTLKDDELQGTIKSVGARRTRQARLHLKKQKK